MHLSAHNLLSSRQYDFCKERSAGSLLAFLPESWPSFLRVSVKSFNLSETYQKPSIESDMVFFHFQTTYGFSPYTCSVHLIMQNFPACSLFRLFHR